MGPFSPPSITGPKSPTLIGCCLLLSRCSPTPGQGCRKMFRVAGALAVPAHSWKLVMKLRLIKTHPDLTLLDMKWGHKMPEQFYREWAGYTTPDLETRSNNCTGTTVINKPGKALLGFTGSGTLMRQQGYLLFMQNWLFLFFSPPSISPHHLLHQMNSLQIMLFRSMPFPYRTDIFLSSQHVERLVQKPNIYFRCCFLIERVENRGISSQVLSRRGRTLQVKLIIRL